MAEINRITPFTPSWPTQKPEPAKQSGERKPPPRRSPKRQPQQEPEQDHGRGDDGLHIDEYV